MDSCTKKPKSIIGRFIYKVATLNCRTASTDARLAIILKALSRSNVGLAAVQETRRQGKGSAEITVKYMQKDGKSESEREATWAVYFSGGNKSEYGVAMCVR